jgi:predicted ATPase
MITRIYIDNFRCLTNFEVKPRRVNLLIGNNGSGKSTFIEVLHSVVALAAMGESVKDVFEPDSRTRWDSRPTQHIELDVSGNGGTYHYSVALLHDPDRQEVTLEQEVVRFTPTPPVPSTLQQMAGDIPRTPGYGARKKARTAGKANAASSMLARVLFLYRDGMVTLFNDEGHPGAEFAFRGDRSFLPQLEARPENTLLTWFMDFLRTVWLVKLNPTEIEPESEDESDVLEPDGSNFASWYRDLSQEHPQRLPLLFERLAEVLPGFRSLSAARAGKAGRKRELVADFTYGDPKSEFPPLFFDELSDGERATIILYCILTDAESEPRTLLLDEPENFVGLQLIQPWLVQLADAVRDKGQLFVISHNPEAIDYLAADHVLLFERPEGGPSRVRLNPFDRDQGLKASELLGRGLLDAE